MVSFGRHVKMSTDHDQSLKANPLPCCSCFEKDLGLQGLQDVPYYQNHSLMKFKIYPNGQFSDKSYLSEVCMKNTWSAAESSLQAPRQNALRGSTLLWGKHLWELSMIPNTVNSIKEVSFVLFYKVKSKIINIPYSFQGILTIWYIQKLIPTCTNVEKT